MAQDLPPQQLDRDFLLSAPISPQPVLAAHDVQLVTLPSVGSPASGIFRMKLAHTLVSAALLVIVASTAAAQVQVRVSSINAPEQTATTWDPPGSTYGSLYVSPYGGTLVASGQSVVLNCVDFFHNVTVGQTFWANQTYLNASSLTNTRFGNVTWYLQAAWLTQQYNSPDPGSNDNRRIAIQAAIWNIFTPDAPDRQMTYDTDPGDQDYWISRARLATNWLSVDASRFYVLTATNKADANSPQEFLVYDPNRVVATPEPATMILLGSGMAGLAAVRRRRNKNKATPIATA